MFDYIESGFSGHRWNIIEFVVNSCSCTKRYTYSAGCSRSKTNEWYTNSYPKISTPILCEIIPSSCNGPCT